MKGRFYFITYSIFFKDTNFDFDSIIHRNINDVLHFDTYLIPEDEVCPICGSTHIIKNGHAYKTVKHCTVSTCLIVVRIHIQCYICKDCGYSFREKENFSSTYDGYSKESILFILNQLKYASMTFERVADICHLSRQNIIDIFDRYIDYTPGVLPSVLSFDEKHINKSITEDAYLFSIVDFKSNKLYDLLPNRHKRTLIAYFNRFSREELLNVQYVVMDMYEPYLDVSKLFFKNAKIAIDSFHVIQNVNRALDKVRIRIMQKYNNKASKTEDNTVFYYLLKKYRYYLFKEIDDITDKRFYNRKLKGWYDKYSFLKIILDIDDSLKKAYYFACDYREFNRVCNFDNAKERLDELIKDFYDSYIHEFVDLAKTLSTWKEYIINSFIIVPDALSKPDKYGNSYPRRLSSGAIEGLNSILQEINIVGKGYSNFIRFKNRAIYVINKDIPIRNNPLTIRKVRQSKRFEKK